MKTKEDLICNTMRSAGIKPYFVKSDAIVLPQSPTLVNAWQQLDLALL